MKQLPRLLSARFINQSSSSEFNKGFSLISNHINSQSNRYFSSYPIHLIPVYLEKQKHLENYLYNNKKIECLLELYKVGLLNFKAESLIAKDRDLVMKLLDLKVGISFNDLPQEFKKDTEVLTKLERLGVEHLTEEMKQDGNIILKLLESHYHSASNLMDYIKDDEELMLKAIKVQGATIQYANEKLRNKRAVVISAIDSNPLALEFVGEKFKRDKSIIRRAVKINGAALEFASDDLKSDSEIVLMAVKSNPYSIVHASENLKNDPKIAITAVKSGEVYGLTPTGMGNHPLYILEYIGKDLLNDRSFMMKALEIEPGFMYSCYCMLSKDPQLLLSLGTRFSIPFVENDLKENKQFMKKFFKKLVTELFGKSSLSDDILKMVKPIEGVTEYQKDKTSFIRNSLAKINTRESALQLFSHLYEIHAGYKSDRDFILEALNRSKEMISFYGDRFKQMIDPNLLNDKEFIRELIQINPNSITLASAEMIKDGDLLREATYLPYGLHIPRLLALELVSKKGELLRQLTADLREDREIVYKAVLNDPRAINYASESLQKDKKLIHMIIDKGLYFTDIHPDIQYDFDIMKRVFEINKLPCTIE